MSDSFINIRFLWWHLKYLHTYQWKLSTNNYWLVRRTKAFLRPIAIYDFDVRGIWKTKEGGK